MRRIHSLPLVPLIAVLILAAIGVGGLILAYALPDAVACTLITFAKLEALPDRTLVEPGISAAERSGIRALVAASKARIEKAFGAARAEPIVVFYRNTRMFGVLNLNINGTTSSFPGRVCVMVGPKGRSIDIVAHELMHAELCDRVGYWHRIIEVPVWFDEGIAMQVDLRPRFDLPQGELIDTAYVQQLTTPPRFYPPNEQVLIYNYAVAKVEIARWLSTVGAQNLYQLLERIHNGEPFSSVFVK